MGNDLHLTGKAARLHYRWWHMVMVVKINSVFNAMPHICNEWAGPTSISTDPMGKCKLIWRWGDTLDFMKLCWLYAYSGTESYVAV